MKKVLFLLALVFISLGVYSQVFPINGTFGSPSSTVLTKGIAAADSGYQFRTNFPDTTTANYGNIDQVPGVMIRTGSTLWVRNQTTTAWVQIGTGSEGSGTVTSITAGYGLSGGAITTSGTISLDSSVASLTYLRRKDSLSSSNLLGYVTRKILSDTAAAIRASTGPGSGVISVGAINGVSKSANGAVISGTTIYFQTVDGTYPGLMTSAQKARLDSNSYLTIDKTYDSLAWRRNDSTFLTKSLRIQLNGSTVTPTTTDSTLSYNLIVSAGSPAGNFGNVQLNRNGSFATPGSDSLDFDAGLYIKGVLSATALPTGGVDADSVVVINSSGAFKKRNVSAFARMNTTSAAGQLALFNGVGTLYSSSKFVFADASYPYMGMVGSDPLFYFGAISVNNPIIGSGAGLSLYGGDTYESINFYDKINSGTMMARFYNSGGTISNLLNGLIISNTLSSPSNYQGSYTIQRTVPYAVTGLNYHGFTDQTDFRVGTNAFNSFGTFVTIGNNRTYQDHFAGFQAVWYKDSTNRLGKVYDFVSAVSEMRAGTIDTVYRFKVFEMTKTGGTIVKQYGIQIDNLSNATTNVGAWIYNNVGIGPTAHTPSERLTVDGNILGTGTIKTADPGSGAGAWRLGTAITSSGLVLKTTQYLEVSIGGTVYRLALVDPPTPMP